MPSRPAFLAVAVVLVLAAAAEAAPTRDLLIRPGVGIAKARLGMTEAQVRQAMGRPQVRFSEDGSFGRQLVRLQWGYGSYTVTLSGRRGNERVVAISTVLRKERTPEGLGVNSLEAELAKVYGRSFRCEPFEYQDAGRYGVYGTGRRLCYIGDPDGPVTLFAMQSYGGKKGTFEAQWPRRARAHEVVVRAAGYREQSLGE